MKRVFLHFVALIIVALPIIVSDANAQQADTTFTVYGPRRFERVTGAPVTVSESFVIPATAAAPYTLYVINGSVNGDNRVSSGTVKLNGVEVLRQSDFNQQVGYWIKPITLSSANTLEVRLTSKPNSFIIIRMMATGTTSPRITVTSPENNAVTNSSQVTVSGTILDETTVSARINGTPVTIAPNGSFSSTIQLTEGLSTITMEAADAFNNSSTATRSVRLDTQPPVITLSSPLDSLITNQSVINIAGTVSDSTEVRITVNGSNVAVTDGAFHVAFQPTEGWNTVTVVATDSAGNVTTVTRTVRRDTQPPALAVTEPADSLITSQTTVAVQGRVSDSTAITLTVNGTDVPVGADGGWSMQVPLVEGFNTITVEATDAAGNSVTIIRYVQRSSLPPVLSIISPAS